MGDQRRRGTDTSAARRVLEMFRISHPVGLLVLAAVGLLGFTVRSPGKRLDVQERRLTYLNARVGDLEVVLDGLARFACLNSEPTERALLGLGCTALLSSRRR